MSADFLIHIYEPFAQENRPGYDAIGTGLGLAIIKHMFVMMKGTISIASAMIGSVPDKAEMPDTDIRLNGKKVLICEDNALNREIAAELLKKQGMTVCCGENGRDGLNKFVESADHEFDIILMDLRMPVIGVLEAARMIRMLERADAGFVPIIAMTADAFPEDIQKCLDAGMNRHIAKPVIPETLYKTLADAMKHSPRSC